VRSVTLCAAALVLLMAGLSVSLNCPDGKYCPDTSTCCKSERGYGCCPYPHVSFIRLLF
uniref:Granulins domain-containing protein n=1 Tax=Paramormyrops kingsleyae TaxID=1676925 RepID=A0A3B3R4Z4_9TELE